MTTFHHYADDSIFTLTETLDRYAEAGIDPAFDMEMDELERQFAERRFTFSE
jgi:hypothetical protein